MDQINSIQSMDQHNLAEQSKLIQSEIHTLLQSYQQDSPPDHPLDPMLFHTLVVKINEQSRLLNLGQMQEFIRRAKENTGRANLRDFHLRIGGAARTNPKNPENNIRVTLTKEIQYIDNSVNKNIQPDGPVHLNAQESRDISMDARLRVMERHARLPLGSPEIDIHERIRRLEERMEWIEAQYPRFAAFVFQQDISQQDKGFYQASHVVKKEASEPTVEVSKGPMDAAEMQSRVQRFWESLQ